MTDLRRALRNAVQLLKREAGLRHLTIEGGWQEFEEDAETLKHLGDLAATLERIQPAFPVLTTVLRTAGLGGAEISEQMLAEIREVLRPKDRGEIRASQG